MSALWAINYKVGANWVGLQADLENTYEELNGHSEAIFKLPNSAANRTIVGSDRNIQVLYNSGTVYLGSLNAVEYGHKELRAIAYDSVFELMKKRTISGEFNLGSANIIFGSICAAAGVGAGTADCSGSLLSVRFDEAYCFDAMNYISECTNQDRWSSGGSAFIGAKGTLLDGTLDFSGLVSNRGIDRAKVRDKVLIRGVDVNGLRIFGSAGTGDNVAVYTDKKGCDQQTLNLLAERKLSQLNNESSGVTFRVPINVGVNYQVGDYKAVQIASHSLDGTYRIYKATKYKTEVEVEIDRPRSRTEEDEEATGIYEELGIYKLSPSQMTPLAISMGGMEELFHLNEGSGSLAWNSRPLWISNAGSLGVDATILNGHWEPVGQLKALRFDGDGYITNGTRDYGAMAGFTISMWTSPVTNGADVNYLAAKTNVFYLQHYSVYDKIRFGIKGEFGWGTLTSAGTSCLVNGRNLITGVYDFVAGSMYIYTNGTLNCSKAANLGSIEASSGTLFIGANALGTNGIDGYIGEVSVWSRSLSAQEVSELYFFPLTRIVKKVGGGGSAAPTTWTCTVNINDDDFGSTNPSGATVLADGEDLVAEAFEGGGATFREWRYDGTYQGTNNPITIPAEPIGEVHSLLAVMTGPISVANYIDAQPESILRIEAGTPLIGSVSSVLTVQVGSASWVEVSNANLGGTLDPANVNVVPANAGSYVDYRTQPWGYHGEGTIGIIGVHPATGTLRSCIAQSFTGDGGNLYGCSFFVKKVGAPSGTLRAILFNHAGTYGTNGTPVGSLGLETSSDYILMQNLGTVPGWFNWNFAGTYPLPLGTKYFIALACTGGGTVNATNYVTPSFSAGSTHGGNRAHFSTGTWNFATTDLKFMVFKSAPTVGSAKLVIGYPNLANGYVMIKQSTTLPLRINNAQDFGTLDASGQFGSVLVAQQPREETVFISVNTIRGFGVVATGTTSDGYNSQTRDGTLTFTRSAGSIHSWLIDGVPAGTASTQPISKTDGYHTIQYTGS